MQSIPFCGARSGSAAFLAIAFGLTGHLLPAGAALAAEHSTGAWSSLAGGVTGTQYPAVRALAVFDDGWGDGPVLYAAGSFTHAGGVPATSIARWNGTTWSAVGAIASTESGGGAGNVVAMTVWPTPKGDLLVIGGEFRSAGGVPVNNVAAWDGISWSGLGPGLGTPGPFITGSVRDLAVVATDDPITGESSAQLYAAGTFQNFGPDPIGPGLARFDDGVWMQVGPVLTVAPDGVTLTPRLAFHDDGKGLQPYLGGRSLVSAGEDLGLLATLEAGTWVAVDGLHSSPGTIRSLRSAEIDGVSTLFVGGSMGRIGVTGREGVIVRRQGAWHGLGNGLRGFGPFSAGAIAVIADGLGDGVGGGLRGDGQSAAIYLGGDFALAGGTPARSVARWNGTFWNELAGGVGNSPASPDSDGGDDDAEPATLTLAQPSAMILDPTAPPGSPRIIVAGGFKYAGSDLVNGIAAWTPPPLLRPGPFVNRCEYDVEPIGSSFSITALTEDELVAGHASGVGVLYVDGALTEIAPPPPATGVVISDVNDSWIAVGALEYSVPGVPGGSRGFRLDLVTGVWTIFNTDDPACNGCRADAIGNDGTIFGYYQGALYTWVDGVQAFPKLDDAWVWMRPRGANSLGQAVGNGNDGTTLVPTLFDGATVAGLEVLDVESAGIARRINDDGTIIGVFGQIGVIWEAGAISVLTGPAGAPSDPVDINNAGDVIGRFTPIDGSGSAPAIWIDGVAQPLRSMVSWKDTWQLGAPSRINESRALAVTWTAPPFSDEPGGRALLRAREAAIGDVDGDCRADLYDLGLVLVEFGRSDSVADLDGDGIVDGFDLGLVLSNWTR